MKRILLLSVLAVLSVAAVFAKEAPSGYYIQSYWVSMTIHEDNTYTVMETLDVYYTEPSHGFFRDIPNNVWIKRDISEAQDGSETAMKHYPVEMEDVEVQGYEFAYDEYEGNHELKIGSRDIYVEGLHRYNINYTLKIPADRVPQSDIFFYSVLGTGWDCDVDTFRFMIDFDKPLPQSAINDVQLYVGAEGDHKNKASDCLYFNKECTRMSASISGIPAFSGVTVWLPLPEGYFTCSEPWQTTATLVLIGIAALIFAYVLFRELLGDKHHVTKVISFRPPKGMSSAHVGTLIDASIDERDILSLIPWFASKGYLTIDNSKEHPVLIKKENLPASAPKFQETLFNGLFPNGTTVFNTGEKSTTSFGKAWLNCESQLNNLFKDKLDNADTKTLGILVLGIFVASFAVCFGSTDPDSWIHGGFTTLFFVGLSVCMLFFMSEMKGILAKCFLGFFITIGTMMFLVCYSDATRDTYVPVEYLHALVIGAGVTSIFAINLTYMTDYRSKVLGEILGLEEFIRTAEKDQLEKLQAEDEKYFYDILPYAMCFGLAERWEKKFKDIHVAPSDNFVGSSASGLITGGIANSLANRMFTKEMKAGINAEKAARSAAASSSSSGSSYHSSSNYSSGSHGYSGGGFGGGGGRRW